MGAGAHEVRHLIVAGAADDAAGRRARLRSLLAASEPLAEPAPTRGDDPAFWLYSSGSTGKPKGTVHTHANACWTAELYGKRRARPDRRATSASPPPSSTSPTDWATRLTFPLAVGATVVLMAERPTPDAVFKRWTGAAGGDRQGVGRRCSSARRPASPACSRRPRLPAREAVALRMCSSAGEALPAEIGQRFSAHFGCEIIDGIGSTEMLHVFLSNRPGDVRYGTTGKPVEGYEIELRGDDGRPVADGEVGDLYIKGPSAALMYWGNREKSRETFQGDWTKSGDKYVRDADGYYTYSGRSDDMLKVSGICVSPFEVEATLMQHPAVLECAVIGTEDARGPDQDQGLRRPQAGRRRRASRAARPSSRRGSRAYKYPRAIEFIDELPKTATGKIQRFRLRERERGGAGVVSALTPRRRELARSSHWRGRRDRASSTNGSARRAPRAPLGRLPARRSRLGRDVEGLPARVLRGARRCAASCSRATATAARRRSRATSAGRLDFMHAQAHEVLPALFAALGIDAALAVRPQRRRLDRPAPCRALHPASRAWSRSRRTCSSRTSRSRASSRRATPIETTDLRAAPRALPRRPRLGVLRLERRLARPGVPRTGTSSARSTTIGCPVLAVQGEDDEYGTLAQIRGDRAAIAENRACS